MVCTKCKEEKEPAEYLKNRGWCKDCRRDYHKAYRAKNREKLNEYHRSRYAESEDVRTSKKEASEKWRSANSEKYNKYRKTYGKAYREDNRDQQLARCKSWREENPDKVRAYSKQYTLEHKDVLWLKRVLAANPNAFVDDMTYQEIIDRDSGICYICGSTENITIDHLIPLCAGGDHTRDNVSACCNRCNGTKGRREPHELPEGLRKSVQQRIERIKDEPL